MTKLAILIFVEHGQARSNFFLNEFYCTVKQLMDGQALACLPIDVQF